MKNLYIGIILAILIILINICYLLTKKNNNLHEPFFTTPSIAVVGNGEITDADREKIKKCTLICRFNDTKNHNYLEKTDILFVRQNGITGGIHGLNNYTTNINCKEMVFIGSWKEHYDNLKKYNKVPIRMIDIYEAHCKNMPRINKCTLNGFNKKLLFEDKKYNVPYTSCYLSSGTIAINYLLDRYPNANLEIFGMNWQFHHSGHPKNFEKKLITNCKRCNINKMKHDIY